jgi:hypothetical protein
MCADGLLRPQMLEFDSVAENWRVDSGRVRRADHRGHRSSFDIIRVTSSCGVCAVRWYPGTRAPA